MSKNELNHILEISLLLVDQKFRKHVFNSQCLTCNQPEPVARCRLHMPLETK